VSGRKAMRAFVGWPRAERLVDLAGWSRPTTQTPPRNGNQPNGTQPANNDAVEDGETRAADHIDSRTTP
jgi:hypothetical protein